MVMSFGRNFEKSYTYNILENSQINLWHDDINDNLSDNLPDWASPGNWLGPEGHADLINLVNDPSLYKLCIFPLKLFNVGAVTASSFNLFHWLITLSEKNVDVDQLIHDSFVTSESPLVILL